VPLLSDACCQTIVAIAHAWHQSVHNIVWHRTRHSGLQTKLLQQDLDSSHRIIVGLLQQGTCSARWTLVCVIKNLMLVSSCGDQFATVGKCMHILACHTFDSYHHITVSQHTRISLARARSLAHSLTHSLPPSPTYHPPLPPSVTHSPTSSAEMQVCSSCAFEPYLPFFSSSCLCHQVHASLTAADQPGSICGRCCLDLKLS
jgi:hypothetical protein